MLATIAGISRRGQWKTATAAASAQEAQEYVPRDGINEMLCVIWNYIHRNLILKLAQYECAPWSTLPLLYNSQSTWRVGGSKHQAYGIGSLLSPEYQILQVVIWLSWPRYRLMEAVVQHQQLFGSRFQAVPHWAILLFYCPRKVTNLIHVILWPFLLHQQKWMSPSTLAARKTSVSVSFLWLCLTRTNAVEHCFGKIRVGENCITAQKNTSVSYQTVQNFNLEDKFDDNNDFDGHAL